VWLTETRIPKEGKKDEESSSKEEKGNKEEVSELTTRREDRDLDEARR